MKQQWSSQELIDHWTLTQTEIALAQSISKIDYNRLGYALMLKYFQLEGKFPQRKQDIPGQIIIHIAQQLRVQESAYASYNPSSPDSNQNPYRQSTICLKVCSESLNAY
jgi:hypothetical protein